MIPKPKNASGVVIMQCAREQVAGTRCYVDTEVRRERGREEGVGGIQ